MPTRAEMSATVKAAARAAAARLASDKSSVGGKDATAAAAGGSGRSASASGSSLSAGGGGSGSAGGGKRIERDIFAARPSRGQALGVSAGGYDVFPETGDFETYDSDEVGGVGWVDGLMGGLVDLWIVFPLRPTAGGLSFLETSRIESHKGLSSMRR